MNNNVSVRTVATAIASVIAYIILCLNTFKGLDISVNPELIEAGSILIATGVLWFISHYFNQDYSPVAIKITKVMRELKKLAKSGDAAAFDEIIEFVNRKLEECESENNNEVD